VRDIFLSERVLCALLSTFSLDISRMILDLPEIFSKASRVESLILSDEPPPASQNSYNLSDRIQFAQVCPGPKGVNHAKYICLFTEKGFHLMITTANLTNERKNTNMSWTHFFPLRDQERSMVSDHVEDFASTFIDFLTMVWVNLFSSLNSHSNLSIFPPTLPSIRSNLSWHVFLCYLTSPPFPSRASIPFMAFMSDFLSLTFL
jgi:hypothetical protein